MQSGTKDLADKALDAVFVLLPEDLAREAKARTRAHPAWQAGREAPPLAWADFSRSGAFVHGGLTDLAGLSVRLVPSSQIDPHISVLVATARAGDGQAGAIVPVEDDALLWFVPLAGDMWSNDTDAHLRGLRITQPEFEWALETAGGSVSLTPAERRIVYQLVRGHTARQAAAADGVSFETKRAQIKSAAAKLGLSGQSDLVRMAVGQMFTLFHASAPDPSRNGVAENYTARYLADDARLAVHSLSHGRQMRVLTCGPRDGRPVLVIHGMMFPILLRGSTAHLEKHGLRLVVPLRSGFLDPFASFDAAEHADHIDQFYSDLAELLSLNPELRRAPLLGHSFGAVLAVALGAKRIAGAGPVVLASPKLATPPQEWAHTSNEFYSGMLSLTRNRALSQRVTNVFKSYYDDPRTGTTILRRLFHGSPSDQKIIVGNAATPPIIAWFADLYRTSILGIADDFCFDASAWWDRLGAIAAPVHIIAGDADPLTPPDVVERMQRTARDGHLHCVPGGHFVAASHADAFWRAVTRAIDFTD